MSFIFGNFKVYVVGKVSEGRVGGGESYMGYGLGFGFFFRRIEKLLVVLSRSTIRILVLRVLCGK